MPYALIQCGALLPERYATHEEAQAEADAINTGVDEELGCELVGDGACSIVEISNEVQTSASRKR